MKITCKSFVHFLDKAQEIPIEEITQEQKIHLVNQGTIAFMKEVGVEACKKRKDKIEN